MAEHNWQWIEDEDLAVALSLSMQDTQSCSRPRTEKISPEVDFDTVVSLCKVSNDHFVDPDFEPTTGSWRFPASTCVIFDGPPRPTDARQVKSSGEIGDCWLVSALCALAERPKLLEKVFTKSELKIGVCELCLFPDGEEQTILIDTRLPTRQDGNLIFANSLRPRVLWASLIEKAFAKIAKSYRALHSGTTLEALSVITGMPCEVISLDNANPKWDLDYVWTQLLSFRHAKYLLAATCNHTNHGPDAHALMGLNELHAYALLDVKEYGQTRLVKLRNPWGKGEWLGDWSHGSHLWTPLLRQHFEADTNSRTSNGGVFFMAFKDFVDYFTTVDVCKVLPDWDRIVFPCRAIDIHAVPKFTAFQIQALVTGECEISVIQKNTRGESHSYLPATVCVLRAADMRCLKSNDRLTQREAGVEVMLEHDTTYLVVPVVFNNSTNWPSHVHDGLVLVVHSSKPLLATPTDCTSPFLNRCLVERCRRYGNVSQLLPGVLCFTHHDGDGTVLAVANSSPHLLTFELKTNNSSNVAVSRSRLAIPGSSSIDRLLPGQAQLIAVSWRVIPTSPSKLEYSMTAITSSATHSTPADAVHQPSFPGSSVHVPFAFVP